MEASEAKLRVAQLLEELEDAKEGLQRSTSTAADLKKRHEEGRYVIEHRTRRVTPSRLVTISVLQPSFRPFWPHQLLDGRCHKVQLPSACRFS